VTVMLDSFFGLHPHVVRSGLWAKMKPGEKDLYVCLMAESERRRTRLIKATDPAIHALVGVASRTLCNARKKLREYGLILYKAEQGNRYTYTICDPKTGAPYPGDPKDRVDGTHRTRSEHQETAESPAPTAIAPPKPPKQDLPIESYGLPNVFSGRSSKPC
jgi:hypothetical protein